MKKLISTVLTLILLLTSLFAEQVPTSGAKVYSTIETIFLTEEEIDFARDCLFEKYAQKDTLPREEFETIKTMKDLYDYLHKYINDNHFFFDGKNWNLKFKFELVTCIKDNQDWDEENPIKSIDEDVRKYIKTKNAEYVRVTSCGVADEYEAMMKFLGQIKGNKKFIILDYRTNGGGGAGPQNYLFKRLSEMNYKGKIICLQDNYSASAAELGRYLELYDNLDIILIGQNSDGANISCTPTPFESGSMRLKFIIPVDTTEESGNHKWFNTENSHWEGEGKGYRPDIKIDNNEDFVPTLEGLGVDMVDTKTKKKIVIQ
jgi:hypothetical protein